MSNGQAKGMGRQAQSGRRSEARKDAMDATGSAIGTLRGTRSGSGAILERYVVACVAHQRRAWLAERCTTHGVVGRFWCLSRSVSVAILGVGDLIEALRRT